VPYAWRPIRASKRARSESIGIVLATRDDDGGERRRVVLSVRDQGGRRVTVLPFQSAPRNLRCMNGCGWVDYQAGTHHCSAHCTNHNGASLEEPFHESSGTLDRALRGALLSSNLRRG